MPHYAFKDTRSGKLVDVPGNASSALRERTVDEVRRYPTVRAALAFLQGSVRAIHGTFPQLALVRLETTSGTPKVTRRALGVEEAVPQGAKVIGWAIRDMWSPCDPSGFLQPGDESSAIFTRYVNLDGLIPAATAGDVLQGLTRTAGRLSNPELVRIIEISEPGETITIVIDL